MKPVYYIALAEDDEPIQHDTILPAESLMFQSKHTWYNAHPDFVEFEQAHTFSTMPNAWGFMADFCDHMGTSWFVVKSTPTGMVRLSERDEKRCQVITAFDDDWTDAGAVFIHKVINNKRPVHFINGYVPIRSPDGLEQNLRDIFGRRARFGMVSGSFTVSVTPHTLTMLLLAQPAGVDLENLRVVWTYSPDKMTLTKMPVDEFLEPPSV